MSDIRPTFKSLSTKIETFLKKRQSLHQVPKNLFQDSNGKDEAKDYLYDDAKVI